MFEVVDTQSINDKLMILADAAKYDVACTSSGADRRGKKGMLGNCVAPGVCHTFAADGRCVSLLKILMSNHCVYDCKYCHNRASNDCMRATFTPDEICTLTIEFYKRNYIEGLFLSSGVIKNPTYTMEQMVNTLRLLRTKYKFNGYIHVKAIPGAPSELIYSAGLLADRISINMELPTQRSLKELAPNKSMNSILKPMDMISSTIAAHRVAIGLSPQMERASINKHLLNSIFGENEKYISDRKDAEQLKLCTNRNSFSYPAVKQDTELKRSFASAGQSTQMIIGATDETDFDIIRTSESLYKGFDLKRVFYSGYIPLNEDSALPPIGTPVPMLREHRLYQADFLLRYYGFHSSELLSEDRPNFDERIDPKCYWAVTHLEKFPVEINTATYDELLRVPGIGPTSVKRIMETRRSSHINFEMLKKMGAVLKRAKYFITCNGQMFEPTRIEEDFIVGKLTTLEEKKNKTFVDPTCGYRQMDFFTDFGLQVGN